MDSMDLDHDMDVDIDLVPDEPIVPEPDPGNRSPGEVDDDPDARVPSKIYIQGLDVMNPDDVKAYVAQHCSDIFRSLEKIEWIDDSSANLLFASESIASRALIALAIDPIQDVSQLPARRLLSARPFSTRPDIVLKVRHTLESDRKQVGAASRSRFYLLHPEYDPEERRRKNEARRYRDRDGDNLSRRRARQIRDEQSQEPFDVNLYDDTSATISTGLDGPRPRRRRSYTLDSDTGEPRRDSFRSSNHGKELFPDNTGRRHEASRDRSASPTRDRDGHQNMEVFASEESAAARERNRHRAHTIKSHLSRQNRAKELFPTEVSKSGRLGDNVEDAATLLAKGITLPLMDGSNDEAPPPVPSRKLEDRITVPGKGKLADRVTNPNSASSSAFNIRGTANQRSSGTGFAIKGSAGKSVKELFPDKFGSNAGRELFADGPGGRSRQRQKAGDLFD
ncbi:hypothetical protein F5Y19DRAFT_165872 [Xylariaceae sp. FL1651]|nr:hypothetical protein F5Y19DRAFT_165872 [Xylariaceae sp. FL1651]